jgi:aminopeptidase N
VNKEGSVDMYYKGANMLHTLRQLIEDDEKWRQILRGLNITFYHQTVTTKQIEDYISEQSGIDLTEFFNQYLRSTRIPTLEYSINKKELKYRWTNIVDGFDMPIQVKIGHGKNLWLFPKAEWKSITFEWNSVPYDSNKISIEVDPDFYVEAKKI